MQKLFQIISVTIVVVILTTTLVGCNPFDNGSTAYLTQKMDEIPIEFDGYELVRINSLANSINGFSGQATVNGTVVAVESYVGDYGYDYLLIYDDNRILICDEFMRQKSEVYVKIHDIWCNYGQITNASNRKSGHSQIYSLYVFDDNLFIITNGLQSTWTQKINVIGFYPITLYKYDLIEEKIYYAGYLSVYNNAQLYITIKHKED